jgi:hypothetical protein
MNKKRPKSVGWRIPDILRQRVNAKAELRGGQSAEEFVIECLEENTRDLEEIQNRLTKDRNTRSRMRTV